MDRYTMNLRSMLTGNRITQFDIRNGRSYSFIVKTVVNNDDGYITIKGDDPFDTIYLPVSSSEELAVERECTFRRVYDTSVLEYKIAVCFEEC